MTDTYNFRDFMKDLAAIFCVGSVMILMMWCFLNGGQS